MSYPIVAAGAVIRNNNKIFLMKSSGKFGDSWIIPGGKVDYKEKVVDTVKREIKEETNLDIFNIEFLGYRDYVKNEKHFVFLEFVADAEKIDYIKLNYEASEYKFFSKEELLSINLAWPTKALIETYSNKLFWYSCFKTGIEID